MSISDLFNWFSGGSRQYMSLYHCMNHDVPWVAVTVVLDLAVALGYSLIALHWWRQQRGNKQSLAHRALGNMKNIFVFCGICGYLFIPIKMVWPAWRLYDIFLAVLAFYTWRYAWNARGLKVIYDELTRSEELKHDIVELKAESQRKTFFLNSISHDLRTPLNGMMLQVQLAEMTLDSMGMETDESREFAESIAAIRASARVTAEMLEGFLELGRLDWGEDVPHSSTFDVGELLRQVCEGMRIVADQKQLDLAVDAPLELAVRTDRAKLERIVLNLVINALKYTEVGGVRVEAVTSSQDLTIHVEDSGVGIEAGHLEHLFDEFYQVNNHERDRKKGFGLGLSIASRLAEKLGGRIDVISTPGRGSRFSVTIPGVVTRRRGASPASHPHR